MRRDRIRAIRAIRLPGPFSIARYWCTQSTFDITFDDPRCFGCLMDVGSGWDSKHLQRCHLVSGIEGGSAHVKNIVLLCKRCHRAAPMIGSSAQPMLDWLKRREKFEHRMIRLGTSECIAISPTLPKNLVELGLSRDEFRSLFTAVLKILRAGYHPGGDPHSTVAATIHAAVKLVKAIPSRFRLDSGSRDVTP